MKRSKYRLCFLLLLHVLLARSSAEQLTLNINYDKPISVTDEKFLSLTVHPATLLTGGALSTNFERSVNLARALSPAYVRFEGARNSFFRFTDPDAQDNKNGINIPTESNWILTHRWAKKAGLDVIACISPDNQGDKTEDATEMVSFSDHMAFNASWQLGYECQTGCNVSAGDLARQTVNLRKILNEFPRYSNSIVAGPDVVAYRSEKQRRYLRDYFDIAAPALSAITWHPDFAGVTLDNEGAFVHQDSLEKDKEELLKVIGRFANEQPLWIAESKPEECKNLYIGALILARRLGNAARSKINVFMRQPTDLTRPSPDYWVSLLHKTLVGRKVFDVIIQASSKNHAYLYCQCTKASNRYQKGSITIFGVNLNPEEVVVDLKGIKINTVHEYILSPGFDAPNRMFSETVFLNNKTLNLINDTVPEIHPVILSNAEDMELELHPGGIGFWVLPDLKIKSCMEDDGTSNQDASSSFNAFEDLKSVENVKVRVTRSVQDQSTSKSGRKENIDSEATRKSILKRELKKLRQYTKKKLDDFETTKSPLKSEDSSTSKPEDSNQEPQDNIQSKLQEFKDRILRIRSISNSDKTKSRVNKIVNDVSSLLSKVQNALDPTKQETDHSNKLKSRSIARNHLKALYDFLNRVNLNKSIARSQQSKLFKRDVYSKIADLENQKREDLSREQPKVIVKRDFAEVIRPSVVEWENSDSDEHTFYGFFDMNPVEGFPRGDVHFATEGLPRMMNSDQQKDFNPPEPDYPDSEEEWSEEYDELGKYLGPAGMMKGRRVGSARRSAELWEAETFEPRRKVRFDGNRGSGVERYPEIKIDQKSMFTDYEKSPFFGALASSMESDYSNSGRFKREIKDVHTILDQEMINEDDANLKDCNCRVIRRSQPCNCRSKRDVVKSTESATVSEVESLNSHDIADVEVFAELKEAPMEATKLRAESITLEGIPSEPIDATSRNLYPATPFATPPIPSKIIGTPSVDLESINSEISTIPSSVSNEDDESARSLRAPIRRRKGKFFREKSKENKTEEATIDTLEDPAEHGSNSWGNSTPSSNETATEKGEESSSTTIKSATLWEPDIAKEAEMDYNNDQIPAATTKRQVTNEKVPKVAAKAANKSTSSSSMDSRRNRRQKQNQLNKKSRTNVTKARESQLMQRARVLSALAKMIRGKTGDEVYKFGPKSRSRNKGGERSKNQEGQGQKLKDKVPEKRNTILQRLQKNIDDEMNEMAGEGERNLKRRQVWEMIEDTDDFRDVMDYEKLACVLVYKPAEDDDNESYESVEKRNVPMTEIVREKDIREKIFNPKSQRNHRDSTLVEHSDPQEVKKEIIELRNLYEKEAAKVGESDEDDGMTYFALVENLDKPRFFRLREKQGGEKRNVQKSLPLLRFNNNYRYNQPKKEIYVIDPSEYRGGEPILQPYKGSLKPQPNLRSRNLYEVIRNVLRKPHKIRKTEQHKREDKVASGDEYETSRELSENINTGELLKVLIDNLDLQSVEELFKQLDKYNTTDEKRNFIRSIVEEMKKKRSEEGGDEENSESMENSRENESLEMLGSEEMLDHQTESYLAVSIDQDTQSDEDDATFEVSVVENHSDEGTNGRQQRDANSKSFKSLFTLEAPLKGTSESTFDRSSSRIIEMNKLNRFRRQAVDPGDMNEDAELIQPSELQQLEGSSSPKIQTSTEMDDIEKSLVQKIPIEKYTKKEDLNKNNDQGLQALIQKSIPSLQNVVVDGLQKAQNFTGSVEQLIENLDENIDEGAKNEEENDWINSESITSTRAVFNNAIKNVKKFFALLGGITRILQG